MCQSSRLDFSIIKNFESVQTINNKCKYKLQQLFKMLSVSLDAVCRENRSTSVHLPAWDRLVCQQLKNRRRNRVFWLVTRSRTSVFSVSSSEIPSIANILPWNARGNVPLLFLENLICESFVFCPLLIFNVIVVKATFPLPPKRSKQQPMQVN